MRALLKGNATKATAILIAVVAATAVTTMSFAGDGDKGDGGSVPGVPVVGDGSAAAPSTPGDGGTYGGVITNSSTFDPTILTKFIPAATFTKVDGDVIVYDATRICVHAVSNTSSGTNVQMRAPVELPDGARILRYSAYGRDQDATNMTFYLDKTVVDFPFFGSPTITETSFTNFNTSGVSGSPGIFGISNGSDLNELTGDTGFIFFYTTRYYELYASLPSAAGANHSFCGMQVTYQVPAVANAVASAFYPISPIRAFDSRIAAYAPLNGVLAPNTSRVINIKDGHDSAGTVNLVDAVPAGATAVTYNITVTGTTGDNYLAVTPGDAGSFTASAINFGANANLANAATVTIASDRTIKVWCGDQTGSTHVIIDITGYYAPLPNMGN